MRKEKELIKNTFIILLGKFCTQFLSYFLLPLYTSVLNSSQYGIVDLITTYITLAVPIISLQMEMGIFRELIDSRNNNYKINEIITSGMKSVFVQLCVSLIIYFVLNIFIDIPYSYFILFTICTTLLSNLFLQISRGLGNNIAYSIGSVIAGVSTILFNILFLVILNFKIEGMILSTGLGNLLATIFLFFKLKLYNKINIKTYSKNINIKLLKYSLPLVPNGLIWWVINVSDRTLISWFLGTSSNGIYAVSNKLSNILIQVYNVFNLSWTESASFHINDEDKDSFFSRVFNEIINIFYSVCIIFVLFMPFIFKILINQNYIEAYMYIPLLLLGTLFNIVVSFIGCIYVAKKLTKQVARTSLYAGIINILINVLLIKQIGIYAAAISTVLAFFIMSVYRFIDVQKYVKLKLDIKNILFLTFLFILVCTIYYINNLILNCIGCFTISIILIIYNKEYIYNLIKKVKLIFFK